MRNTLTTLFLALAFVLSGCAHGAYKVTYTAGATTTQFVKEAHTVYDDEANARLDKCDPERNPDNGVKTQADFDECMGPAYTVEAQDKVVQALAIYNATMTLFSAVMLGCEPPPMPADPTETKPKFDAATCAKRTFTDKELRAWRAKVIDAAFEALAVFPDADAKVKKLSGLVGR